MEKKKKCTIVVLIWETLFYYKKIKHFQIVYGVHSPTLHHSLNPSIHPCIFYFQQLPIFLPDLHLSKLTWVWPLEWLDKYAGYRLWLHPPLRSERLDTAPCTILLHVFVWFEPLWKGSSLFSNENESNRPANQANMSRNCYISVKIGFSALSCAGRKQNKSCYYLSRCANCNILLSRT